MSGESEGEAGRRCGFVAILHFPSTPNPKPPINRVIRLDSEPEVQEYDDDGELIVPDTDAPAGRLDPVEIPLEETRDLGPLGN